ncbi:DUF5107 domain-containing protein [Demequina litorisediminis]|uniref:DUF5107 domain-containing protein n=1 Tax=Demequina litorisediminis TaxID=1849022 RepID=UPI0032AFF183
MAARVHDDYQSFFPEDVRYVADHARRALTAFPAADRPYYNVDYPALAAAQQDSATVGADRIDWYRNIPVPTSYMIVDSQQDFFGGYDHAARAGFVHWAERRVSPGKKQWTWGNAPFGHAWDDQAHRRRRPLRGTHGRRLHGQPTRLHVAAAGRNQDLHAILVPHPRHRPRAPGHARCRRQRHRGRLARRIVRRHRAAGGGTRAHPGARRGDRRGRGGPRAGRGREHQRRRRQGRCRGGAHRRRRLAPGALGTREGGRRGAMGRVRAALG